MEAEFKVGSGIPMAGAVYEGKLELAVEAAAGCPAGIVVEEYTLLGTGLGVLEATVGTAADDTAPAE
jgi:hypothetical protein